MKHAKVYIVTALTALMFSYVGVQLFGDAGSVAQKESAAERVLRTGTLRCGYASASILIKYDFAQKRPVGAVAQMAEEMAKRLGLKLEWTEEVGYADFAEGLKNGRYDAFCGMMSITPERARQVTFTQPLFHATYYAFQPAGGQRFASLADMNRENLKYAVIDGEVFQPFSRRLFPKAQEYALPNMTDQGQLFVDIANGKADFVVHDMIMLQEYEKSNPGQIVKALDNPVLVANNAFSVANGEAELLDMMNAAILTMQTSDRIDAILNTYNLGPDIVFRSAKPYQGNY